MSLNLLDFTTGAALDFFAGNDKYASVYGILPFPGVTVPETGGNQVLLYFQGGYGLQAARIQHVRHHLPPGQQ
ncbi:DUF6081 family protein [Paenibacillus rhizoplanae]